MRTISPPILSLLLLALFAIAAPAAQQPPDAMHQFLRDHMGFSPADVASVVAGRAVARQMKTPDPIDVNIFGAVRLGASADAFVQQVRQIDTYERRIGIISVGKFQNPPQLSDLDGLTLDRDELAEIRACRPGDCDAQLPPQAIARFQAQVDWRAPGANQVTDRIFREELFNLLTSYRAGGHAALAAYDDRPRSASLAAEFHLL